VPNLSHLHTFLYIPYKLAFTRIIANPLGYAIHKAHTLYRFLVPNLNFSGHSVKGLLVISNAMERVFHFFFFVGIVAAILARSGRVLALLLSYFVLVIFSSAAFFNERFVLISIPFYFIFCVRGISYASGWFRSKASRLNLHIFRMYNHKT
jgi:hypothetical protein